MKNNDNKQINKHKSIDPIPKRKKEKEKAYLQNFDFAALSTQFSSVLCFRAIYILLTHRYIYWIILDIKTNRFLSELELN